MFNESNESNTRPVFNESNESNTRPVFNESDRAYVDYNYGTFSPLNIAVRKNDYKTFVRLARNITEYTDIRVAHMCDRIHARGLA